MGASSSLLNNIHQSMLHCLFSLLDLAFKHTGLKEEMGTPANGSRESYASFAHLNVLPCFPCYAPQVKCTNIGPHTQNRFDDRRSIDGL